jgi:predicted TIM-barrel fold metal-dependent hydrolase
MSKATVGLTLVVALAAGSLMLDANPNLYADIGARYAETATIPRYMARFFDKYQDRLVYGTDLGMDAAMYRTTFRILESADEHSYDWNLFTYHWPLHGFALGDVVLKKIYRENALRILKTVQREEISGPTPATPGTTPAVVTVTSPPRC